METAYITVSRRGILIDIDPVNTEAYNAAYYGYLREVYRMLHQLGTSESKSHIEKMSIQNAPVNS